MNRDRGLRHEHEHDTRWNDWNEPQTRSGGWNVWNGALFNGHEAGNGGYSQEST
jgi:hypothetical protein